MSPIISPSGSGGGGSQPVLQATHNFTAAQLRSLFTDSPITLIAAPGSGKMIVLRSLLWVYTFGTKPFFSSSGLGTQAQIGYGAGFTPIQVTDNGGGGLTAQPTESLGDSNINPGYLLSNVDHPSSNLVDGSLTLMPPISLRTLVDNQALTLIATHANMTNGQLTSSTINAAGSGYAAGDTLADSQTWGDGSLLVTVNTVDGSGHVLTYTVTNTGIFGWSAGQVIGFDNVAPQMGAGTGFQISAGITPGDGTLKLIFDYEVLTL